MGRVADLGCGKLRHYKSLVSSSDELFLVDTPQQLSATHSDNGQRYTISDVASGARVQRRIVHVMPFDDFAARKLYLDLIVCVAVLDVVLPKVRKELIRSAARNLASSGLGAIVVPRNDSTILSRCGPHNAYSDGHVFPHHGVHTFFHNFRDHLPIVRLCESAGLRLVKDLSCYRQVCLIVEKR